jgi:hypothetical protein
MTRRVETFSVRRIGETCQEVLTADGNVIAWTADGVRAAVLVRLLNGADADGLASLSGKANTHNGCGCSLLVQKNR